MDHFIAAFSRDITLLEFACVLVSSGFISIFMVFGLNILYVKREELVNLIDSMEDEN